MSKFSYKEIERQRREDDILEIAERLLMERGYVNLNMDELARVVGISKPTLYQHFKGKDELAVKVMLRSYRAMDEYLAQPLEEPAIDRLIGLIRRSLMIHSPGSLMVSLRGQIEPESIWKMLHNNPTLVERKNLFMQRVYTLVDKAKEQGAIEASLPTPIVTQALFALNRSLTISTYQSETSSSPEKQDCAVNSVIHLFLHGVTPTDHSGDGSADNASA